MCYVLEYTRIRGPAVAALFGTMFGAAVFHVEHRKTSNDAS